MMDNLYVRQDPAGNIQMDKEKSTEKIDAAVATVIALDRAIRNLGSEGSVVFASYLLGFFPKCSEYLPTLLTDGNSLIYGIADAKTYSVALIIAAVISLLCFVGGITTFSKKQL